MLKKSLNLQNPIKTKILAIFLQIIIYKILVRCLTSKSLLMLYKRHQNNIVEAIDNQSLIWMIIFIIIKEQI
jgi:hypothetical protein